MSLEGLPLGFQGMHHLALLIKDLLKRYNLYIPKRVQLLSRVIYIAIHEVLLIYQLL
jgi:hypothetical protein